MAQNDLSPVPLCQSYYEEKCHSYDEVFVDRNCDEVCLDVSATSEEEQESTKRFILSMQQGETSRAFDSLNQTFDDISRPCLPGSLDALFRHPDNQRENQVPDNNNFWKGNVVENTSDGENNNNNTDVTEAEEDNLVICYCPAGEAADCSCLKQTGDISRKNSFCFQDQFQDDDPLLLHSESYKLPIESENSPFSRLMRDTACSTPDPNHLRIASDTDDLEYEYEPGISLADLEFGRAADESANDLAIVFARTKCLLCGSDYESDLQLAAELGKTLLERNKTLESSIKNQQAVIEDQAQEIEYLSKQNTDLRDVNESRLKIYEQLEVSISELEIANKKLLEEGIADKATIKMLCGTIERLETKCDELQRNLDEAESESQRQVLLKRRRRRSSRSKDGIHESEFEEKKSIGRDSDEVNDTDSNDHFSEPGNTKSRHLSNSLTPQQTTSSSPISSSGYSSSSVDLHQQRFSGDSDSETNYLISKKPFPISDHSETSNRLSRACCRDLKVECMVSKEKILEMEKEMSTLFSALSSLRSECESMSKSSEELMSKSVEDEVQDVACVKTGRLCRKCLGLVDATPANLIGSAFQNMGDTFKSELRGVITRYRAPGGWSSSHPWLDIAMLGLGVLVLAISIATSVFAQLLDLCT